MNPMAIKRRVFSSIVNIYSQAAALIKRNAVVFYPFAAFAAVEALALTFLFLIPREPFVRLFGPPVRTFWGEQFLHYPFNFLLLPKLAYFSRTVLSIIIGSFTTGMAVILIVQDHKKMALKLAPSFKQAVKRYASFFMVTVVVVFLLFFGMRLVTSTILKYFMAGHARFLFIGARLWLGPILTVLGFLAAILVQACFVYAVPLIVIDGKKAIKALAGSFIFFKKNFFITIFLVTLPMLIFIPFIILQQNSAFLVEKFFPEIILIILYAGILLNSIIIDFLVTTSATIFYLKNRQEK